MAYVVLLLPRETLSVVGNRMSQGVQVFPSDCHQIVQQLSRYLVLQLWNEQHSHQQASALLLYAIDSNPLEPLCWGSQVLLIFALILIAPE